MIAIRPRLGAAPQLDLSKTNELDLTIYKILNFFKPLPVGQRDDKLYVSTPILSQYFQVSNACFIGLLLNRQGIYQSLGVVKHDLPPGDALRRQLDINEPRKVLWTMPAIAYYCSVSDTKLAGLLMAEFRNHPQIMQLIGEANPKPERDRYYIRRRIRNLVKRAPKSTNQLIEELGNQDEVLQQLEFLKKRDEIIFENGKWDPMQTRFLFLLFTYPRHRIPLTTVEIVARLLNNVPVDGVEFRIEKSSDFKLSAKKLRAKTYCSYMVFIRKEAGWERVE